PVTNHVFSGAIGQLEADLARAQIDSRIELEPGGVRLTLRHYSGIIFGEFCGVNPRAYCHAPSYLKGRRITDTYKVIYSIKGNRVTVLAGCCPGWTVCERSGDVVTRCVRSRSAGSLFKRVTGSESWRLSVRHRNAYRCGPDITSGISSLRS